MCGTTQCTNCIDDDGDGLTDEFDPHCTGPLDDDETSVGTGVEGTDDPCFQRCSSGVAECEFDVRCLSAHRHPVCPFMGAEWVEKNCSESALKCITACVNPRGCDYSGCCDVFDRRGARRFIKIVPGCDLFSFDDPMKCPPCSFIDTPPTPSCAFCDCCCGIAPKPALDPRCFTPPRRSPVPCDCDAGVTDAASDG